MRNNEIIYPRVEPNYCGPACLAWVAYEQGLPYPDQEMLAQRIYEPDWGTSGEGMLKGCEMLGLHGEWVQRSLDDLQRLKKEGASIVLSWMSGPNPDSDGHYSVYWESNNDTIVIQDPAWIGAVSVMRRDLFEGVWYDFDDEGNKLEKWALIVSRK